VKLLTKPASQPSALPMSVVSPDVIDWAKVPVVIFVASSPGICAPGMNPEMRLAKNPAG
jgi:hypothetical protein